MSNLNPVICGFTPGSSLTVRRTVTKVPKGSLVQTAVFTVKAAEPGPGNADIILKTITTVDHLDVGEVENEGSTGTCQLRFELTETDTMLLEPNHSGFYQLSRCRASTIPEPIQVWYRYIAQAATMYCPCCGLRNSDSASFCRSCGADSQTICDTLEGRIPAARLRQKEGVVKDRRGYIRKPTLSH